MTLYSIIAKALRDAERHNSQVMVKPAVILWPDPERQFESVIESFRADFPALLRFGPFNPARKQGPAIWIKCMVARTLPEADWPEGKTPIIYLPGISKSDLRDVEKAPLLLQPLLEYQYTGTIFLQENGREWSIAAFIQNQTVGLGKKVAQDNATKEALRAALPGLLHQADAFAHTHEVTASFLNRLQFPRINEGVLRWLNEDEAWFERLTEAERNAFRALCKSQFGFLPEKAMLLEAAAQLGTRKGDWMDVWELFASAPKRYPRVIEKLRAAKPKDLGQGLFQIPPDSWPQVNEDAEASLRQELTKLAEVDKKTAAAALKKLLVTHEPRLHWVWSELGQAPVARALQKLVRLAELVEKPAPSISLDALKAWYESEGHLADRFMRQAYAEVQREDDKKAVTAVISCLYANWLDQTALSFQSLVDKNAEIFRTQPEYDADEELVLFVDAFRYELAAEFVELNLAKGWKMTLSTGWSAIPSLTPTAKPAISPMRGLVSEESPCEEFRPAFKEGKPVQHELFKKALESAGYAFVANNDGFLKGRKQWREVGSIDEKGHAEQAGLVRRIPELLSELTETIEAAFEKGIQRITMVTDHGWLLLPGGLPKAELNVNLTETRWGRCAIVKEGAKTELLRLPWRWNPMAYIAYAPGASFFKKNEAYAHGGLSIQECLVPIVRIENPVGRTERVTIKDVTWVNLRCTVQLSGPAKGAKVDIRGKVNDPDSSFVLSARPNDAHDRFSLLADDEGLGAAAFVTLIDAQGIIIDKIKTTVGGD
jgi:hypothetical protein